jgi:hypothetical protein
MKTRLGFVSNSSSSSYLVAIRKNPICSCCGRGAPDFDEVVNSMKSDARSSAVVAGKDQVASFFASDIVLAKSPEELGRINVDLREVNRYLADPEWKVVELNLSYHDESLKKLFSQLVQDGKIIFLKEPED